MKIVFFGTPDMAAHILDALIKAKVDIGAIVTKPDTPQGRSLKLTAPAVKLKAQQLLPDVPILQPVKCSTNEMIEALGRFKADLFVVVAYGEILSESLLNVAPLGAINVHFSLLPAYRGAAPVQRAIMNGEKETGVSVIRLVKKMDAGDILYAESCAIPNDMTGGELAEALCALGTKCLFHVLDDFAKGTINPIVQDHTLATFANKITTEECQLDWGKSAQSLCNLVRAMSPHPGAWCQVTLRGEKKRLKVFSAEVVDEPNSNDLIVACQTGFLRLVTIQLEGKPKMQASDFLRGIPASQVIF